LPRSLLPELEIDILARRRGSLRLRGARRPGRPSLYEYRPLVRGFVEKRSQQLMELADAQAAIEDLRHEKAAAIFARAHAGEQLPDEEALFMTVLLPLLVATTESCGGFDWHDDALRSRLIELEGSLFGGERSYMAVAPLVGLSLGAQVELGEGVRVRIRLRRAFHLLARGERDLPREFGRRADRLAVIELRRDLGVDQIEAPDAPAELADAIKRRCGLATAGAIARGRCCSSGSTSAPTGIGRILPSPLQTFRRGDPPRPVPRQAGARPARPHAAADEDRHWRKRSTAGNCRSSARSPSLRAAREALTAVLRRRRGLAMAASGPRRCSATDRAERAELRVRLRALAGAASRQE